MLKELESYLHISLLKGECLITGLEYWNGLLEWTTGLTFFFWFYTCLRVGLLYIWVTCDNISALSGDYVIAFLRVLYEK